MLRKFIAPKQNISKEENAVKKAEEQLSSLKSQQNSLVNDIKIFTKKIAEKEIVIKELDSKISDLNNSFSNYKKSHEEITQNNQQIIVEETDKINELKKEVIILTGEKDKKISEIKNLQEDIVAIHDNFSKAEKKLADLRKMEEGALLEYQSKVDNFLVLLNNVDSEISEKTKILDGLNEQITLSNVNLDEVNLTIENAKKKEERLNDQISEELEMIAGLKKEKENMINELSEIVKNIEENGEEYEKQLNLAKDLAIKESEINRKEKVLEKKYKYLNLDR